MPYLGNTYDRLFQCNLTELSCFNYVRQRTRSSTKRKVLMFYHLNLKQYEFKEKPVLSPSQGSEAIGKLGIGLCTCFFGCISESLGFAACSADIIRAD